MRQLNIRVETFFDESIELPNIRSSFRNVEIIIPFNVKYILRCSNSYKAQIRLSSIDYRERTVYKLDKSLKCWSVNSVNLTAVQTKG